MTDIDHLAGLLGIEPGYWDLAGQWHGAAPATKLALITALRLDPDDAAAIEAAHRELAAPLPEGPVATCPRLAELGGARAWGVTCQAYGLRSARNAGIGDLEDVAALAERLAAEGADFLGLSPMHALFPEAPARYSPYSPSSRRWLNELLIAVDAACARLDLVPIAVEGAAGLRAAELIDYPAVAAAKQAALARLWQAFHAQHLAAGISALGREFKDWQAQAGEELERFCRFQAMALALAAEHGRPVPLSEWPQAWCSPDTAEVAAFAARARMAVDGRAFLQWLTDRQLAQAQARARAAGMRIGLYIDLATGVVPDGAEAWADPAALVQGATMGAPPDPLGPFGQNWNVVAPSPLVQARTDAAPLRATLRAAMRHAGAIRIDHALGLMRLFLVPPGCDATAGAYLRYPYARLLRAVAEEARAAGCMVIGEDLGTVPEGFREPMAAAGVLGYRVAWFERDWHGDRGYLPPERFPAQALATLSTHDLPTVRGHFLGQDIAWRERLGLYPAPEQAGHDRRQRADEVELLRQRLRGLGLLAEQADETACVLALHRYLARAASELVAVQLEDLTGETEQPNLPGTVETHPNWRRRYALTVEELTAAPFAAAILAIMREERPR